MFETIIKLHCYFLGIGIGIFYFSNQTHINMYNSNEVTILRDDTVWLTSGCPDSRSCFHLVTPSTVKGTTVAQWSHSRHLIQFRVGWQFKGSGIKWTIGHTREYLSEKTSAKRFWTAQHPKLDLVK